MMTRTFSQKAAGFALAVLVLLGATAAPMRLFAADVAPGQQLARQWCISCHVFPGNSGQVVPQGPPGFGEIARGDKTADQLKGFLAHPHGSMPPLTLSRAEIADLVAYIETLR